MTSKNAVNIKPILFNTEMVRAILDGRKTMTRRVVKPQHLKVLDSPYHRKYPETPDKTLLEKLCTPPYCCNDILYVRETFWKSANGSYVYKADSENANSLTWLPSIHMPREAARIFLRVTNVRVERLNHITVSDVSAEGTPEPTKEDWAITEYGIVPPFCWFARLWDSTVKPADLDLYGWDANPWVWVIEFKRISKEDAQKCRTQ